MWGKARLDVPERLGVDRTAYSRRICTRRVAAQLAEADPDVIVVVKGDDIDPNLWLPWRARGVPVVLWLYDEIRRTHFDLEELSAFDAIATYSPIDRNDFVRHGLTSSVVPLAFDPRLQPRPGTPRAEVVFVGARYPTREALLLELWDKGVPIRAYGRDWSHHPVDRVRTLDWSRPGVPSSRDVTRDQAVQLQYDALCTLNVHGDQDGFNIRTFEACGVRALQIVDRHDVADLYEPGREVLVFDEAEDLVELIDQARSDPKWAASIRAAARLRTMREHTFAHRCRELLELC